MIPLTLNSKSSIYLLVTLNLLVLSIAGSNGYTYNKPSGVSLPSGAASNQYFTSISTVKPLPPLPALPALPTARPQTKVLTQSLLQTHPTRSSYSSGKYSSNPLSYGGTSFGGTSGSGSSYKNPTAFGGSSSYSGVKSYGGSLSYNGPSSYGYKTGPSSYGSSSYSSFRTTSKPVTSSRFNYKTTSASSPSSYSSFGRYSTIATAAPTKGYNRYGSKYNSFSSFSTIPTASTGYDQNLKTYTSYGTTGFGSLSSSSLTSTAPQTFGHNRSPTRTTVSITAPTLRPTYNSISSSPQSLITVEQPTVLLQSTIPEQQSVILNASGPNVQLLPLSQTQSFVSYGSVQPTGPTASAPIIVTPTLSQPIRQFNSEPSAGPTVSSLLYPQSQSQPQQQSQPQLPLQLQSQSQSQSQSQLFSPQVGNLASAPPLRIPFGKTAVINIPQESDNSNDDIYELNGRQLKQYAVVEIIDNDIEPSVGPRTTYNTPFFDGFRARLGASTTGAYGAARVSISNDLQQQRNTARLNTPSEAIALGSGGLGFIRSSNGNVYLGSGSLGYISSQQHLQSLTEARTRSGATQPDALHFGHGPLGGNPVTLRFK